MSHELRSPLTSLIGFIETLRGAARDDPGARERAVATDGIADLNVDPVVAIVPRGFGADRVRGVIRGLLLRMESDTMA